MSIRVRFAPSPTGYLHLGGARTALFNYLLARKTGGTFVLRIDDTDPERSKKEFEEDIISQMKWLGFDWDEGPYQGGDFGPYRQSEKFDRYKSCVNQLVEKGVAYRDEDQTIRLKYPDCSVSVKDQVSGISEFTTDSLGPEPVILRSDGSPTYHLASTVDDIDMGITHIIRGQDHLTNTAKHCILFDALGAERPEFAHLPLILGADGSKLSKRNAGGFVSVKDFREKGYLPEALNNFLLLLGWSPTDDRELFSLDEVFSEFDIQRVRATAAKYEVEKLNWFNGHWIRKLEAEEVASRSEEFLADYQELVKAKGKKFWPDVIGSLQDSVASLCDSKELAQLVIGEDLQITDEAKEFFSDESNKEQGQKVIELWENYVKDLEIEDGRDSFSAEEFSKIVNRVKKESGIKGKALFKSTRFAITLDVSGPELKNLVPFIERRILLDRAKEGLQFLSNV